MPNSLVKTYPALRRWPKGIAGRPPSHKALEQAHKVARPGTKSALAVAMALRPNGTTQKEIILVLGQPHRNKLKAVAENGLKLVKGESKSGHLVYKLELKK